MITLRKSAENSRKTLKNAIMLIQGPWPLRKIFISCVKVIFLDIVFNDEQNDTFLGSLSTILPDLNESIKHAKNF